MTGPTAGRFDAVAINDAATADRPKIRAVCGSSSDPYGSGKWLWVTSV